MTHLLADFDPNQKCLIAYSSFIFNILLRWLTLNTGYLVIVLAHNHLGDSIVIGLIAVCHVRGLVCLFCHSDCKGLGSQTGLFSPVFCQKVKHNLQSYQ